MTERVLVDGDTFFVTDGQFETAETGGLYHRDTRYLSEMSVSVSGKSLTPIGSDLVSPWRRVVTCADVSSAVNEIDDSEEQKHTTITLTRDQVVAEGQGLVENLALTNHAPETRTLSLEIDVASDFRDLFEIRGLRSDIERDVAVSVSEDGVRFSYDESDAEGDGAALYAGFDPTPATVTADGATYELELAPQTSTEVTVTASVGSGVQPNAFARAADAAGWDPAGGYDALPLSDSRYAQMFEQSWRDLQALVTDTEHGPVALAGVPWFATVFGRDALLTAYNMLHVTPVLAEGTLKYLAAYQGTEDDDYREERPGKIFHEIRQGELARRGRIPHTPYYGTVDATPLWLILLDETRRWTGDDALVEELWGPAEAAAGWLQSAIEDIADDPFLYYTASEDDGLAHKAWRDTERSIQFADGEPARPPLASVEVQGYAYDAFRRTARLARLQGQDDDAREYERQASAVRSAFNDEFWLPEQGYYAAAKTAQGRLVTSQTSNVGHTLWSGIVPDERTEAVVDTLLGDDLYSGWGVRTMSTRARGYSPVSYHVGSVWPHDNALIALGARERGYATAAETIATDVLDACATFEYARVPELYCGFSDSHPPYRYPSACEPQAWSATAPFAFLRALFDITPDGNGNAVANASPGSLDIASEAAISLAKAEANTR